MFLKGLFEKGKEFFNFIFFYLFLLFCFLFGDLIKKRFHKTNKQVLEYGDIKVIVIPALMDNYSYLVIDTRTMEAFAIDPLATSALLEEVKKEKAHLSCVFVTHHHWDHSGGNIELNNKVPRLRFVGSKVDEKRIPCLNYPMQHNQFLKIGHMKITGLLSPCHTRGHMLYLVEDTKPRETVPPLLFTGDTLFVGGCGKFFEGTAKEMLECFSMINSLPDETLIFPGHEYAKKNLSFGATIEPSNKEIQLTSLVATERLKNRQPVLPFSLKKEKLHNVFLHCPTATLLHELRKKKDNF